MAGNFFAQLSLCWAIYSPMRPLPPAMPRPGSLPRRPDSNGVLWIALSAIALPRSTAAIATPSPNHLVAPEFRCSRDCFYPAYLTWANPERW